MTGRRRAVVRSRFLFSECGGGTVPTNPNPASGLATLAEARRAGDDGEFERCLALCDAVRARDTATQIELALLRARAHVRLDRGDRALEALRKCPHAGRSLEQQLAAEVLTGAAYVRLGQAERGAALLAATAERAKDPSAPVWVELTLQLGIATFRLGAYDEADRLLAQLGPEAGAGHAGALEYRGWIARARGRFALAAQFFQAALAALATCRRHDRYVEATCLYGLTAVCAELMSTEEWPLIERHLERFDWPAGGAARWRFWTCLGASMICETIGDTAGALRWARQAERTREGALFGIAARCRLAAVCRGLGEFNSHADLVECACEAYEALDLQQLEADLPDLPLYLAEEIAHTSAADTADALLNRYRETTLPSLVAAGGSDRHVALFRSIEAALLEARGATDQAVQELARAYDVLVELGYRRRATWIALRLARLTGEQSYVAYAESALRGTSPQFWMARELAALRGGPGPNVTATEMAILRLLVQGKTYKEIAAARRASVKTIDNHVQALFRKFRVHSRGELAAEALRRGIVVLHRPAPDGEQLG